MLRQTSSYQKIFAKLGLDSEFSVKQEHKTYIQFSPRELAALFARCVTVHSSFNDMVARRGSMSIFSAFSKMYPEVNCTTICC